ncbi:MAG: hypothetical protein DMG22_15950 [Acidobacteria bacterium]|nr:MAG: hypothetical protein DMG22_15950 [Acidobacteriota bacterium]
MSNFLSHILLRDYLPVVGAILLIVFGLAYRWLHVRAEEIRGEAALVRYSNLHLFTSALSDSSDPKPVFEEMLNRTLHALGAHEGCLLLRSPAPELLNCLSTRGLSPGAVMRLKGEPLHAYVATCAARWGSLIAFEDLRQTELAAAWRRDPVFQEFRDVFVVEGWRTLVVVGLQIKDRSYGALMVGSRRSRSFRAGELRLMLAIGNQLSVSMENRHLRKGDERNQEELRILYRIEEALNATFDLEVQLQILKRELKGLVGATNFCLAFRDSPTGRLETVAALGQQPPGEPQTPLRVEGLMEYVLRTGAPLMIGSDFLGTARRLGIRHADPRIATWCGVPVHFSDGLVGVLSVADFEREHALDEKQFDLLKLLAGPISVAFENARLFHKEQRRARHLALLNELGRKAAAVLNPQELLTSICPEIRSAFGYELVRAETLDAAREELVVEAQEGYGAEAVGRRFKLNEGYSGRAASQSETVLVTQVARDDRDLAIEAGAKSALSLPLRFGTELLGVMSIASLKEHAFAEQDVQTLGTLADQLGQALHNAHAFQSAKEEAITDGLTGLKTHRYFMEALEGEWKRSPRTGKPFSVIMMDLDGFKPVNDRHGHLEGDKVLVHVAHTLEGKCRQSNVVARYGGDEFSVLMPECTAEQAEILAERLRATLASDPYLNQYGVTASFGIAAFPTHGTTPEEILRVADSGMYLAKHEEGDRVRVATSNPQTTKENWEQELVKAYLGVAVKRMFATGPETFNTYLQRFKQGAHEEGPSLMDTVTALAFAIDAKDHYTQGHSQTVSRLAAQIAHQIELPEPEIEEIRLAGILHDVGKIGVPESVLNKPSRLTPEEYEIMKSHTVMGWRILEPLRVKPVDRIRWMVRHHHEHFDGSGYPDGLKGADIPLGARILTIADAYDTMVSQRAYKKDRTIAEALEELQRCKGSQFDALLVQAFVRSLEALGAFPSNEILKLN